MKPFSHRLLGGLSYQAALPIRDLLIGAGGANDSV